MFTTLTWLFAAIISTETAGGTISGKLSTFDGGTFGDTIVFLESADAGSTFPIPATATISQKGTQFSPALLIVSVGQSVQFKNDEDKPIDHNVFSRSPAKIFDFGFFQPPEVKSQTFDKPGVVRLFCSIHRYMDGTIYVCPTPFFAKVSADGTYAINNVPPGKWKLKTWQKRARYVDAAIELMTEASKPIAQDIKLDRP